MPAPLDAEGRPLARRSYPNGMTVDSRFGWIGDAHSGTLLCQWPGCEAEVFTQTHLIDEAADAHWATHIEEPDEAAVPEPLP